MGLNCGIVGLPNVGKSTIFQALTSAPAEAANYPFCTIEPNTGIVNVPDKRMKEICSWTLKAQCLLSAGGLFFCETGDEQKDLVIAFLKENNLFEQTEFYQDLAGRDRGFLIRFS